MTNRSILVSVVAVTAFLINPNLGCGGGSSEADDFTYDETDMQAAVLGTWSGTLTLGERTEAITIELEQATAKSSPEFHPPSTRLQCGDRSFVKPAAACVSMSTMPVVGTLTSESGDFDGAITGGASAFRNIDTWDLDVTIEGGRSLDGMFEDGRLDAGTFLDADRSRGEVSLQRLMR